MIAALDSSLDAPSAADADAARAAGVGLWCGYLATRAGVGLLAPWPQLAFENARRCGGPPVGFCSGWDDPVAIRQLAAAWNVRACLDVEDGIRGLGGWAQPWLDASGAGVYGLPAVHGLSAPFHLVADYPGADPASVWPAGLARPEEVHVGWQWQGTHQEFGRSVDRLWVEDWFGGVEMLDAQDPVVVDLQGRLGGLQYGLELPGGFDSQGELTALIRRIDQNILALTPALQAMKAELDQVQQELQQGVALTADQVVGRLQAALAKA